MRHLILIFIVFTFLSFRPQERNWSDVKEGKDYRLMCKHVYHVIDERDYHYFVDTTIINDLSKANSLMTYLRSKINDKCDVWLYNNEKSEWLIRSQNKEAKEYVELADYCIAVSYADSIDFPRWYPLQDHVYKISGGKNWKNKTAP